MGSIVRTLLIIVAVVLVVAGAGYFFGPKVAARTTTLEIERPAPTVLARLSSTPVGATVVEGVTIAEPATVDGDTVTAPVTFADGATGRVVYTVSPAGEGSRVLVKLEQDLGANPLDRLQVLTGGDVGPLMATAASAVETDLNALPNASFEGLQYSVAQVEARPFFYVENCSGSDAESITSIISQAVVAIPPVMRSSNLTVNGELIAVEPRVVSGQYCYQVGYPYQGRQPRALLIGKTGQTPAGTVLRVVYTGTEENVLRDVYNPMDALLAAAHLDNPATPEDDWTTFEVYHDDPTQAGGSRNREIFYVVQGDITALTRIAPPSEAAAVPAAAPAATETPAAPAATTPAPATP
ncbi:MAG TPA: hypothetical protein VEA80_10735 [Vitreimonas sp.]|uniref:hypothetical protein n=1 Tax=Vitreimonas sp. TaxID=3069702 RepID=UPI002D5173C3|nr:hypothetical protein [Vitreimonas sp.]HYD87942.1 hypothetical protein [Vitreimonas sp.]